MSRVDQLIQQIEEGKKPIIYRYDSKTFKLESFEILAFHYSPITDKINFDYKDIEEKDRFLHTNIPRDISKAGHNCLFYGQFVYYMDKGLALNHARLAKEKRQNKIAFMTGEMEIMEKEMQAFEEQN